MKILTTPSRKEVLQSGKHLFQDLVTTQYDELSENLSSGEADEDRSYAYSTESSKQCKQGGKRGASKVAVKSVADNNSIKLIRSSDQHPMVNQSYINETSMSTLPQF